MSAAYPYIVVQVTSVPSEEPIQVEVVSDTGGPGVQSIPVITQPVPYIVL